MADVVKAPRNDAAVVLSGEEDDGKTKAVTRRTSVTARSNAKLIEQSFMVLLMFDWLLSYDIVHFTRATSSRKMLLVELLGCIELLSSTTMVYSCSFSHLDVAM